MPTALYVPGGDEGGGDLDEDLEGTWVAAHGRVTLAHPADTFLRDMELTLESDRLRGGETFGRTTIRIELLRR